MNRPCLRHIACLLTTLGLAVAATTTVRADAGDEWLRKIHQRYRSIKTVQGAFIQTIKDPRLPAQQSSGLVYFMLPGKMRWEYTQPGSKWIVRDGEQHAIYDAQDKQALRGSGVSEDDAMGFLWGKGDLPRQFRVAALRQTGDQVSLDLLPVRDMAGVKRLRLVYDTRLAVVLELEIQDFQERQNRVVFSRLQVNQPLADATRLFSMQVPDGTEVIELNRSRKNSPATAPAQ